MNYDLASYLKSKKGLDRLIEALKDKYVSLGRYSGTIVIYNVTIEESNDMSNFFGQKINVNSTFKTSYKKVEKKLKEGKYKDFNWTDVFYHYFGKPIISKIDLNLKKHNDMENFFLDIKNKNKKYLKHIDNMLNDKKINLYLKNKYIKDKKKLSEDLNKTFILLDNIPQTPTIVSVYASLVGNPHYLDLNTNTSELFLRILSFIKNEPYPMNIEKKKELFSMINIYFDPLSNFVITYNLIGNKALDYFYSLKEAVNLNLFNIVNFSEIDSKNKTIFIFENPSMLESLKDLNYPIIITSGNPNLALFTLLDKLSKTNNKFYYNGDFDSEGLLIADKLKIKYPNLKLFCYSEEDYNNTKANNKINESRIKKLDNIKTKELGLIKNLIKNNRNAGYQEKNIDRIRNFMIKCNK